MDEHNNELGQFMSSIVFGFRLTGGNLWFIVKLNCFT
jgi:hypothetical protein